MGPAGMPTIPAFLPRASHLPQHQGRIYRCPAADPVCPAARCGHGTRSSSLGLYTKRRTYRSSSGAYLYDHDDLAIGSGAYPFNLGFHRSYNSNNAGTVGPLGAGWTHNFNITARINSDGLKGLGQDSPIDGAAAFAASYVIQDLLSDTSKPIDKFVVATLVQKWLMDRLINNTVNVTNGSQGEQFVLLADGSQAMRSSDRRIGLPHGGAYTLTDKYGTTTSFNTAGNVTQWQTHAGTFRQPHLSTASDPGSGSHINATTSMPTTRWATSPRAPIRTTVRPAVNTWDAGRRLLTTTLPSSAGGTGAGVATALTYDRRRPRAADPPVGSAAHDPAHHRRHLYGRRASRPPRPTPTATSRATLYDLLDRLAQHHRRAGARDPLRPTTRSAGPTAGVPTPPSRVPSRAARWSSRPTRPNGQRAPRSPTPAATPRSFAYDGFDRLATTTCPDSTTEAYTYDADLNANPQHATPASLSPMPTTPPTPARCRRHRRCLRQHGELPADGLFYDLTGCLTGVSDNSASIASITPPGTTTTYSDKATPTMRSTGLTV